MVCDALLYSVWVWASGHATRRHEMAVPVQDWIMAFSPVVCAQIAPEPSEYTVHDYRELSLATLVSENRRIEM